jgi:hypothetical protein
MYYTKEQKKGERGHLSAQVFFSSFTCMTRKKDEEQEEENKRAENKHHIFLRHPTNQSISFT